MTEEYCVRYGNSDVTARTDYDTLKNCEKYYEKLKGNNDVIWAEIIYSSLDENDDNVYVIRAFEKDIVDFGEFGKMVRGIKEENYNE